MAGLALKANEGGTALTVTVTAEEVELVKLASPPYCAVILLLPVASDEVA